MSLEGKLEDLSLGEILQIVSLSRKTGILNLSSKGREGAIFFRLGMVISASSSAFQQSLGEILMQKGVINLAVLRKALSLQQAQGFRERLGVILVKNFGAPPDVVEDIVRDQIENVVFSLFAWTGGSFRFTVQDTIESLDNATMDPLQFMLDQGLNPQFLAMEGTSIVAEETDGSSEGDADFAFDLVDGPGDGDSAVAAEIPPVIIVDDDGPTLRAVTEGLIEKGFVVHAVTRSEDALITVDTVHRGGEHPTVLIDLIMPKMDGSGVLGGVELLELLHNNFKQLRLVVMSDYHHADVEKKVHEMGYPFILKPRRAEINTPDILQNFLSQLLRDVLNPVDPEPEDIWQYHSNLGDELRMEIDDDTDVSVSADQFPADEGRSLLRGMLEELDNPDLQGGVLLLVLRFASEFFNRAIIFTITDTIISGSGQFGISGGGVSGDKRVRSIHFPLESDSMFKEPYQTGRSIAFRPGTNAVDTRLFELLGGGVPEEVFIGTIISQSRVIGFLYGDNLPDRHPFVDVSSLTLFLSQAGIAMEKALQDCQLLERAST
ncbi:MAG: response regulator [Desulfuromonadales bacterium]